jgi:hypothetical protein
MKLRIGTQKKETKSSTKSVRLAARLQKALKEKVGETEAIQIISPIWVEVVPSEASQKTS